MSECLWGDGDECGNAALDASVLCHVHEGLDDGYPRGHKAGRADMLAEVRKLVEGMQARLVGPRAAAWGDDALTDLLAQLPTSHE